MPISSLRDRVRRELLEFAWSQWAQLGLAGHAGRRDGWAMDPEALLLLTLEVARRDPRLFDEVLDWLARNGSLLVLQRLRNLARGHPGERDLLDAAIAWASSASPALRWSLAPGDEGQGGEPGRGVFARDVAGLVVDADPVFARFGYRRPRVERSMKSSSPDPRAPIALAFRLRLLFGLGSRADVLRVLLTSGDAELDAAQIADEAAFAKRNVNETLSALAEAGAIDTRWSRNQRVFAIPRDAWAHLLGIADLPGSAPWVPLLRALTAIHVWLEREAAPGWSEYLAASEARSLADRLAPDLEATGVRLPDPRPFAGVGYWGAFEQIVDDAMRMLQPEAAAAQRPRR